MLPLSQLQHHETPNTWALEKSIFVATPVTLPFFVPFLFAERPERSFWKLYALGCVLLLVGVGVDRAVIRLIVPGLE